MKIVFSALFLATACNLIKLGYSQSNCGLDKFQCRDGSCIKSELLCDGRADCNDESDETRSECMKPEIVCSTYAFRCAYGACVDGDASCNGVKDCIDNSDETLPTCRNISHSGTNSGGCTKNQFKCNNGQCIDSLSLCDGTPDCDDRSDETLAQCESVSCPDVVFRCAYGACIDGDLKCNGVQNCADGSDEDPRLCANIGVTMRPQPPTRDELPVTRPSTINNCIVPPQPVNGYWKWRSIRCPFGQSECDVQQGLSLKPGSYLVYRCNAGYKLNISAIHSTTPVICLDDGTWLDIPTCVEIECKSLSSASTSVECQRDGQWASCEKPIRPRTVANLLCRNSYRQDTTLLTKQRSTVTCNDRGQWEPEPIRCVPVCGVPPANTIPLIVNGTTPQITEYPWHATLYRTEEIGGPKEFICGATIIQERLLITAAHCVYDETNRRTEDANKLFVATGNIFRDYDDPNHDPRVVKKAKVKSVYTICRYLGHEGNYAWDIAILELDEPFVLTRTLIPICLDTSAFSDQSVLEVGNFGKVAGFGRTAYGASSYVLQSLTVPYIALNQCKSSSVAYETERYITIDKFCAGYTNGSSVCDGDSGGGLVFKTGNLWYLRGIVSVSLGTIEQGGTRICDSNSYSLYTRVSNHMAWIQDVILKLETFKAYPPCRS